MIATSGAILLMEFFKFLSDHRGLPVYSSSASSLKVRELQMLSDLKDVNGAVAAAILELNGIAVSEMDLPGIGKVMLATEIDR